MNAISGDPKVFVLSRELSEVHLLLDNLSAQSSHGLSKLKHPPSDAGLEGDWIKEICDIDWPPEKRDEAKQAALLIRAKDFLNMQTSPATGMTIAFTLLVAQGDEGDRPVNRSLWNRMFGSAEKGDADEQAGGSAAGPSLASKAVPSRTSLAVNAYPGLVRKARLFRRWIIGISIFLFLWLLVTCFTSWYVGYGNALLGQLTTATRALEETEAKVATAATTQPPGATPAAPISLQDRAENRVAVQPLAAFDYCTLLTDSGDVPLSAQGQSFLQTTELCSTREKRRLRVSAIQERMQQWACWQNLSFFSDCGKELDDPADFEKLTIYATSMAEVLGTGVLPVFYGILGAGAAIVRSISRRIRRSTLSPRDLSLALQQLALGAVVGACIGLFVDGGENGLLGPVTLSGSALSFVAGFGVEQVFAALENLLSRIFNPSPPSQAGPGS
jgi:hypothetical protein